MLAAACKRRHATQTQTCAAAARTVLARSTLTRAPLPPPCSRASRRPTTARTRVPPPPHRPPGPEARRRPSLTAHHRADEEDRKQRADHRGDEGDGRDDALAVERVLELAPEANEEPRAQHRDDVAERVQERERRRLRPEEEREEREEEAEPEARPEADQARLLGQRARRVLRQRAGRGSRSARVASLRVSTCMYAGMVCWRATSAMTRHKHKHTRETHLSGGTAAD